MGTVFLAEHVLIKRRVAIKILHSELATDAEVIERFMNEARAAGTLGHPNIVESTDMGFTRNDVPYIVFEYLEGTLLTDEIYRVGGLPVRRALRIADQIASALDAAHNAGIIHRDLKSDNVFLTDEEDRSITSRCSTSASRGSWKPTTTDSRRGMVMGTPEFMAPEQITSPDHVDNRADIYALGVVLYEMLTARRPFRKTEGPGGTRPRINTTQNEVDNSHALLQRIVHDTPPPLTLGATHRGSRGDDPREAAREGSRQALPVDEGGAGRARGVRRRDAPEPAERLDAATQYPGRDAHAVLSIVRADRSRVRPSRFRRCANVPEARAVLGVVAAGAGRASAADRRLVVGRPAVTRSSADQQRHADNRELAASSTPMPRSSPRARLRVASAAHLRADGIATTADAARCDRDRRRDAQGHGPAATSSSRRARRGARAVPGPRRQVRLDAAHPGERRADRPMTGSQTRIDRRWRRDRGRRQRAGRAAERGRRRRGRDRDDGRPRADQAADRRARAAATLVGLGAPIVLAARRPAGGDADVRPGPTVADPKPAISRYGRGRAGAPPTVDNVRNRAATPAGAWRGCLLLIYVASLLRGRSRG